MIILSPNKILVQVSQLFTAYMWTSSISLTFKLFLHHAGNRLQMSSTKVTKDKPATYYDRPAIDNDKPGRVTDKPGCLTNRPLSYPTGLLLGG